MVENHLDIGGAVVFWSLAEWSHRARLAAHFAPLGLESLVSDPRPAPACLRSALEDVFRGPRVLVRPLASRDGFAVVQEERGLATNRYDTELTARVTGDPPTLTFDPWDSRALKIEDAYRAQLGRIPAAQLSAALVRVIESLGGTRLRPTGAVYWIPGPRIDDWVEVGRAIEQAAEGRPIAVYVLRHRLDRDAIRAIRDAVVQEVQSEADRISQEVCDGGLGVRALEARKQQARELRNKVLLYEEILAIGLQGLHTAVDNANQAAATAAILLGTHGFAEPMPAGVG